MAEDLNHQLNMNKKTTPTEDELNGKKPQCKNPFAEYINERQLYRS